MAINWGGKTLKEKEKQKPQCSTKRFRSEYHEKAAVKNLKRVSISRTTIGTHHVHKRFGIKSCKKKYGILTEKRNISMVISDESWKIPKGQTEAPNGMTNNTMTNNTTTNNTMTDNTMTNNIMTENTMTKKTMKNNTMTNNTMTNNAMTNNTMTYNTMTDNTMTNNTMTYNTMTYNTMTYNTMTNKNK